MRTEQCILLSSKQTNKNLFLMNSVVFIILKKLVSFFQIPISVLKKISTFTNATEFFDQLVISGAVMSVIVINFFCVFDNI